MVNDLLSLLYGFQTDTATQPKRKSIALPKKRSRAADAPDASNLAPARAQRQAKRQRRPASPAPSSPSSEPSPPGSPQSSATASSRGSGDELSGARKIPLLEAKARAIPEATVRRKWGSLDEGAQARVLGVLGSVERAAVGAAVRGEGGLSRRGAQPTRAEQRRAEAQAAVAAVVRQVSRRLPRMPFPKDAREWDFDAEAVRRATRELENSTTATRHALSLLRAEFERESERLADDDEELEQLERNARAEAAMRRRARGKRDSFVPPSLDNSPEDGAEAINLVDEDEGKDVDIDGDLHPKVRPLVRQLSSHIASLESNSDQVRGVEACVLHAADKVRRLVRARIGGEAAEALPMVV